MTPYTLDAVNAIRDSLGSGQHPNVVCKSLGWDAGMFARVCSRHGIAAVLQDDDCAEPPSWPTQQAVAPATNLQTVRSDTRTMRAYRRPLWRVVLLSRVAHRYVFECATESNLSFNAALSALAERAVLSGEAESVRLLERGECRREVYVNLKLLPGVDARLEEICKMRRAKAGPLIAAVIESRARGKNLETTTECTLRESDLVPHR